MSLARVSRRRAVSSSRVASPASSSSSSSEDPLDGLELPWTKRLQNSFFSLAEELAKPMREWLDSSSSE